MILYFTGTGNSKYCAKKISYSTKEELVSLNDCIKSNKKEIDLKNSEILGFVIPTYDYDLAYVVEEYLKSVKFKNVNKNLYTYGIVTCGASSGISLDTLENVLKEKSITLNYGKTVPFPDNYVILFNVPSAKKQNRMFKDADILLEDVICKVKLKESNKYRSNGLKKKFYKMFRNFYIKSQRKVKDFKVNDECIGCGLCSKICPKNIIEIKENKPVWVKDDCSCCLACVNRCPKKAIERGRAKKNSKRYVNPNIKLDV